MGATWSMFYTTHKKSKTTSMPVSISTAMTATSTLRPIRTSSPKLWPLKKPYGDDGPIIIIIVTIGMCLLFIAFIAFLDWFMEKRAKARAPDIDTLNKEPEAQDLPFQVPNHHDEKRKKPIPRRTYLTRRRDDESLQAFVQDSEEEAERDDLRALSEDGKVMGDDELRDAEREAFTSFLGLLANNGLS